MHKRSGYSLFISGEQRLFYGGYIDEKNHAGFNVHPFCRSDIGRNVFLALVFN